MTKKNDSKNKKIEDDGDCSLSIEKLNLGPKKKLIILGLGGLLCQRVCLRDISSVPKTRVPDAAYGSILVYKRPYCVDFMEFCLANFEVGIWSSARECYVDDALDCIMRGFRGKLLFEWDRNDCTNSGFKTIEKKRKPIFLKELKKVWESKYYKLSTRGNGKYYASNTLLIDDNPYKALLNPPHTAIFPNEYKADDSGDTALGPEGELRLYLEGLAKSDDDVPKYVKDHPFGQPAISPDHSDWDYYSKIISKLNKNDAHAN